MTKGQKVTMWVFGLIISFYFFASGQDQSNTTLEFLVPLIIIGLLFFLSFGKKKQ